MIRFQTGDASIGNERGIIERKMFRKLIIGPLLVVHLSSFLLIDWGLRIALRGFLDNSVDEAYSKPDTLNLGPTRRRRIPNIPQ